MSLMLKIAGGVVLAVIMLTVGCGSGDEQVDSPSYSSAKSSLTDNGTAGDESSGGTISQENARLSAENYLDTGAFSRTGLISQLSSEFGDGFSKADAIYAVDHIDVDWNEQAAKSAKNYLDINAFSRKGLIEQLSSEYGDGFTHAQAVYGVNQTGL